jgi:hypothetical protein
LPSIRSLPPRSRNARTGWLRRGSRAMVSMGILHD